MTPVFWVYNIKSMINNTTKITMMHIAAIAPLGSFCFLGSWVGTTAENKIYEKEFILIEEKCTTNHKCLSLVLQKEK